MKKSILLIVAALTIISCQESVLKNDIKESTQNVPLTFSAYSSIATKADNHNTLNFFYTKFNVYGWKSLDNKATWVTTPVFSDITNEYFGADGNGSTVYPASGSKKVTDEWGENAEFPAWYYQNIRYWDKLATHYQFSAYTPTAASSTVKCTPDGKITIGAEAAITVDQKNLMSTPATELAYTGFDYDYMTATSTANYSSSASTTNNAVNLVFTHELAKFNVKLVLDNSVTTTQDVIVKEVSIKNLNGNSSYDSSKETETNGYLSGWSTPTNEVAYSVKGVGTGTDGYIMNGATPGTNNFDGYFVMERLLIPQTADKAVDGTSGDAINSQLAEFDKPCVYISYTIGNETFEGHYALANLFLGTATGNKYSFLGGNEYTLTITVGPRPIYFSTAVNTWVNNEAGLSAD